MTLFARLPGQSPSRIAPNSFPKPVPRISVENRLKIREVSVEYPLIRFCPFKAVFFQLLRQQVDLHRTFEVFFWFSSRLFQSCPGDVRASGAWTKSQWNVGHFP